MSKFSEQQEKLIECLKQINYSYRHIGCGYYRIFNNLNRPTDFIFDTDKIEMKSDDVFGHDRTVSKYTDAGWIVFNFKNAVIEYQDNHVHISNKEHNIFITFKRINN